MVKSVECFTVYVKVTVKVGEKSLLFCKLRDVYAQEKKGSEMT
jgi:hypothetical protein